MVSAKEYTLPSGLKIDVKEPEIKWTLKEYLLPSGLIWKELIRVAKASDLGLWDNYLPLKRACSCESWWSPNGEPRQFNANGSVLWGQDKGGKIIKRDVGACQINIEAHAKELKRLNLDVVNSFDDNISFAKILYNKSGLKPWEPSKQCWK